MSGACGPSCQPRKLLTASRQLRRNWTITRFRDYVLTPKVDGYRALHLVNRHGGRLIEIQLRTPRQDTWANMVEKVAQIFPGIRVGAGPAELRELFAASSELYAIKEGSIQIGEVSRSQLDDIEGAIDRADTFLRELLDEP